MEEAKDDISGSHRTASLILLGIALLELLGLAFFILVVAPQFQAMYDEIGVDIPRATALFLSAPKIFFLSIFAVLGFALVLKESKMSNKSSTLRINVLAAVLAYCLLARFVYLLLNVMIVYGQQ